MGFLGEQKPEARTTMLLALRLMLTLGYGAPVILPDTPTPDTIPAVELGKHVGAVTCIAKTTSGEWWTTGADGTLREWQSDGSPGKHVVRFDPAAGAVEDVKQRIAARHLEGLNGVAELPSGKLVVAQEGPSAPVRIVDVSGDAPKIVVSALPYDEKNMFDVEGSVAVDSGGDVVAADSKGDLCLIDPSTAAVLKTVPIRPSGINVVTRIAAVPGKRQFVFLARTGELATDQADVLGTAAFKGADLTVGPLEPIGGTPTSLAVSAGGEVAVGLKQGLALGEPGKGLRAVPNPFTGGDYALALAFNPAKKTLVCGSALGEIVQVDSSGKAVGSPVLDKAQSRVLSMACTDDGTRVAAGRLDGRFEIVTLDGGAVSPVGADQPNCPPIKEIHWSKGGNILKWSTYDPRVPDVYFDLQQGLVPDPKTDFCPDEDKTHLGNAELKPITLNSGQPRIQYVVDGQGVFDLPRSDCLIASATTIVIAGSNGLQAVDNFGKAKSSFGASSPAVRLALSPDRSLFAAACQDGFVRVFYSDPAKNAGQPLASIFVASNREWVCWNESSGLYTSSPGGDQLFGFQVGRGPNNEAVFQPFKTLEKADQGGQQGFRQNDWLKNALDGQPPAGVKDPANVVAANAPRLTLVGVEKGTAEPNSNNTFLVPPTADAVDVDVHVDGPPGTLVRIRHSVPSAKEYTRADVPGGPNATVNAALVSDKDVFVLYAETPSHVRSIPVTLTIRKNTKNQADGTLRILAIGCDHFDDPSQATLHCCVKDAEAIAQALSDQSELCDDVARADPPRILKDPTVAEANKALQDLIAATQPADRVVIFISSHGFTEGNRAGVLLKDFSAGKPLETGWMWDDIAKQLAAAPRPCRSRIILIDTCHAAASAAAVMAQGEADRSIQDGGTCVVASCLPNEESFEGSDHGLFTSAILDTIKPGKIDWAGQPDIWTGRMEYWLQLFVSQEITAVPGHENDHQTPVVYRSLQSPLGAPLTRAVPKVTAAAQSVTSQKR